MTMMRARLKALTISQLKGLASKLSLEGYTSKKKTALINQILKETSDQKLTKAIKGSREVSWVPDRYLEGLSETKQVQRIKEIYARKEEDPKKGSSYRPFKTDKGVKTKKSKYTAAFEKKYPKAKSLEQKARATGVPKDILQKVYNKGMAAYKSGHRPSVNSQQAWAFARVHSFLMKGCTYYTADKKLAEEAKERSAKAKKHWNSVKCICDKKCS